MSTNQLLDLKLHNLMQAFSHEEGDYVPNIINAGGATVSWKGKRAVDVIDNLPEYVQTMNAIFADMWADGVLFQGVHYTPRLEQMFENVQYSYAEDGTTMEHVQKPYMEANEYDLLVADPIKFITEVLLPRKYPRMFTDRDWAKKALKTYAEDKTYVMMQTQMALMSNLREEYGITEFVGRNFVLNPLDTIFDCYRGFKGTLMDLRRQPQKVHAALERITNDRVMRPVTEAFPYAVQMPHIAAYLTPKQFDEFYWPYEKQLIEYYVNAGTKVFLITQGRWKHVWHHFLELPKDSVILNIDDDDIFEASKLLGDHQIIAGGIKLASIRTESTEAIHDNIKKVIDKCAPGGGFLFGTDKCWISPGDVNEKMVDAFNFAHEYSKR